MRNKQRIVFCVFAIVILICVGCNSSLSSSNNSIKESNLKNYQSSKPIFYCAAGSLYGLCSKSGIDISYDECLRLLPRSKEGNNMLEVKRALLSSGFDLRAEELSATQSGDVNVPCIVLLLPPAISNVGKHSLNVGHYLVLYPVDSEKVEIIDYPRPAYVLPRNYWVKHLQSVGINNIPALLCYK